MPSVCENRLTVVGSQRDLPLFKNSSWDASLQARYLELLESSPCRFVCQYETDTHHLKRLQSLSRRWPGLVFLLDYEFRRSKGLAKAKGGKLEYAEVRY